ncbi:MAG: hypothetical protein ACYDD1_09960 [Caulobacteraceae bacterium]
MFVLEDRPELQPVTRHEPKGTLYGFQAAQGGELVQKEEDGWCALEGALATPWMP